MSLNTSMTDLNKGTEPAAMVYQVTSGLVLGNRPFSCARGMRKDILVGHRSHRLAETLNIPNENRTKQDYPCKACTQSRRLRLKSRASIMHMGSETRLS